MATISWLNHADTATITESNYATSTSSDINTTPVTKVANRQLGDPYIVDWNAESPQATEFIRILGDCGEAKSVGMFAILGHNFPASAYYRVRLSNTSTLGSEIYGSTNQNFTLTGANDALHQFLPLGSNYSARYFRIEIYGFTYNYTCSIGRIWVGPAWDTKCSLDFGAGVDDSSTLTSARGGTAYASDRQRRKTVHVRAYGTSDADFFGTNAAPDDCFLSFYEGAGNTGDVIVLPRNDSAYERHRLGVYGHLSSMSNISVRDRGPNGLLTETSFTVEEDR